MRDLIAKLEKLDGPSREVDTSICIALQYGGFNSEGAANVRTEPDWEGDILFEIGTEDCCSPIPELTGSIDAVVALLKQMMPGWGYRVATCCVSDDAWVFPDFNHPAHGERLKREFDESVDWVEITDVDLRPSGREPIALLIAILKAKEAQDGR